MNANMEFWGVYIEGHDVERPICLCMSEDEAHKIVKLFETAAERSDYVIEVRHVEVSAETYLSLKDY